MFRSVNSPRTIFSFIIAFGLIFTVFVSTADADYQLRRVPTPQYPTIQSAINASSDGDSVHVSSGTYNENIDFLGKAITVKAVRDMGANPNIRYSTIVGTNKLALSTVVFSRGETSASRLEGFIINNGLFGISCSGASPTIIDNEISGCYCGIYCDNSSPRIEENLITANINNDGSWWDGGGIYLINESTPDIVDNDITNNDARNGGGIYCGQHSYPDIENNNIRNNNAKQGCGGGIFCGTQTHSWIKDNDIYWNTALLYGGGIYCIESYDGEELTKIRSNNIGSSEEMVDMGNEALCGAGIYAYLNAMPQIAYNNIGFNKATSEGGGIMLEESGGDVGYNKIYSNRTWHIGGGILITGRVPFAMNVLWNEIYDNWTYGDQPDPGNPWSEGGSGIAIVGAQEVMIEKNKIEGNYDLQYGVGSGIFCYNEDNQIAEETLTIQKNKIRYNYNNQAGGGIYYYDAVPQSQAREAVIWNNLLVSNTVYSDWEGSAVGGGGIYIGNGDPLVANNTLTLNSVADSDDDGGGIYLVSASTSLFQNNIVYGNKRGVTPGWVADNFFAQSGYNAIIDYCDIEGNPFGGTNFDDPPDYEDDNPPNPPEWYRLASVSGNDCIDGGTPVVGLTEDFEGDDRTTSGQAYDVGWDEDT